MYISFYIYIIAWKFVCDLRFHDVLLDNSINLWLQSSFHAIKYI